MKAVTFSLFFSFFPRPWPSVEQNVNVSGLFVLLPIPTLNCRGVGGGGLGWDAGYLAKEETLRFEDYNGLLLSCSDRPNYFCLRW